MSSLFTSLSHSKKLSLFLNLSFISLLSFFLSTGHVYTSPPASSNIAGFFLRLNAGPNPGSCPNLNQFTDHNSKCHYIKSEPTCRPKGYIDYLQIFYCLCGQSPPIGYTLLILWLVVLFYLLGNTASEYFCPSIESLSRVLKLSPAITGTTLLPLGNGATDVLASIVSFTRSGEGDVGLNSVLGGAFFISSVVVGIICVLIHSHNISVDKPSFIRDIIFFLFSLSALMFIIILGKINVWGAISFVSIYFVYISFVSVMHLMSRKRERVVNLSGNTPSTSGEIGTPLLDEEKLISMEKETINPPLILLPPPIHVEKEVNFFIKQLSWVTYVMELPLDLPRRLTIPVVRDEKWSKGFAVTSVSLAPVLLATLWNTQKENMTSNVLMEIYMTSALIGLVLGNLAFVATNGTNPPEKWLLPWIGGGFLMSITWTYIIAEELVSLLVSVGGIMGISPSILGLTVLAWGNSMGDVIANSSLAVKGGVDGAQIAISGCYAGPLFNTLIGLGLSLVFASWSEYPNSYVIPTDPYLFEILGFLMAGLLWALVILPRRNMQLDRSLGGGLLAIYCCFMFIRFSRASELF
ncbi:cation/calcium exchanger 1-like [Impatiens glandulifera]|uniref:cation/calcium exchanger 1-like n=1 Tax=Impatiens glandulifera TaxID=253017 RepID=UPI001FB13927|nr:cation/calcium exchanger 1-like [Impatiens glandulifera]